MTGLDQPGKSTALYAGLRIGMHAMAQPLTRLETGLYLASVSHDASANDAGLDGRQHASHAASQEKEHASTELSVGESPMDEFLGEARADVERLCLLFRLMQQLLYVESVAPQTFKASLSALLDRLPGEAEAAFAGAGLRFDLCVPDSLPRVIMDPGRTRQALLAMLAVSRVMAPPGSRVLCVVAVQAACVDIEMQAAAAGDAALDELTRLHLALAKANILTQQGTFTHTARPYVLAMGLPLADAATR